MSSINLSISNLDSKKKNKKCKRTNLKGPVKLDERVAKSTRKTAKSKKLTENNKGSLAKLDEQIRLTEKKNMIRFRKNLTEYKHINNRASNASNTDITTRAMHI